MARQCRDSRPVDAKRRVRLPGERGYQLAAEQARTGVSLHESILPALRPWAGKFAVAVPGA